MRVVLYWAAITLGPMLLVAALGLATGPHLQTTQNLLSRLPFIGSLLFQLVPVVVLSLTFALGYQLMPNTRVSWTAAMVGGAVSGTLWHLNNTFSVVYVSQVVRNSKIYGSLGIIPIFLLGLYFSWLILLFGAQVAYAFQHRHTYIQEKRAEGVSQRGREFIALRLMTRIGQMFHRGEKPVAAFDLANDLGVPTRLVVQLLETLARSGLLVEVAGVEMGFAPARPLETISLHDILQAIRAGREKELATAHEPTRELVADAHARIQQAEQGTAGAMSLKDLVHNAEAVQAAAAAGMSTGEPQ